MKSAIFDAVESMRVGTWESPHPGPGDVLVRVHATGICAGDLYIYQGKNPYSHYPCIGGHEICGTVEAVGSGVSDLSAGVRVVVEPFIGCGTCYPCREGRSNCCASLKIIGVHVPGGFAEQVIAPVDKIHRVPDALSSTQASFAEPVAIGIQACRRGELRAGETVLILGAGPIGLALIEVALARGARPVVTDINERRLEFARSLGAGTLKADDGLQASVMELTNGEGAPVVIEATGNLKAMESTVDLTASGGRIVIVGLVKRGTMVPFPGLDFTRKELTVVGSRASVNCFPEALDLLTTGKVRYMHVATEASMWDAPSVFARLSQDPAAMHKAVLVVG